MTDKTLAALDASIVHWDDNARAKTPSDASIRAADCALCRAFESPPCDGCPVARRTGTADCDGSPYYRARSLFYAWAAAPTPENAAAFRAAATAERNFLVETRQMYWKEQPANAVNASVNGEKA